jgi:putative intracellular protease/amidase
VPSLRHSSDREPGFSRRRQGNGSRYIDEEGRTASSLRLRQRFAGATWIDEEVHVDNGPVSSRDPGDLPAFCDRIVEQFAAGRHSTETA